MQIPPQPPGKTEQISRYLVVVLRFVFFLLIFYLLLSIAAGLFMPGEVVGRYTLQTEQGETCAELESRLQDFNVNQVSYRVIPADITEPADGAGNGQLCWLEISGVPEQGVGSEATSLYEAALRKATGPLEVQRAYQPRFGQAESIAVWLISLLLAAVVMFARRRRRS